MQSLSPRQQSILNRVIDTHIETAEPVGSQAITSIYQEVYQGSYSSATVRNEMGALESMGYLTHPHTSAGRIPTDRGYRYYVDHGMKEESVSQEMASQITDDLISAKEERELLIEKASAILSDLLQEVSVIICPQISSARTARRFCVQLKGAKHLLQKPEFKNLYRLEKLLDLFEQKHKLTNYLWNEETLNSQVKITIGTENSQEDFSRFSIVSASYRVDNQGQTGMLCVIGPTRMRYSKSVPAVVRMARIMSQIFQEMEP